MGKGKREREREKLRNTYHMVATHPHETSTEILRKAPQNTTLDYNKKVLYEENSA
jgi:hypothetical protein